jgi:DNA-binding MarR family transcriptional regulator/GNAT superfamily N-acetyltransferase
MSVVADVRAFNRFYTQKIGVLDEGLLASPWSLAEVRVLWELAHREQPTASALGQALGLDAGYLSRMLRKLEGKRLITRRRSTVDRRQSLLGLTARGKQVFAGLDARSSNEVRQLLKPLDAGAQQRLVSAMGTIEGLLGDGTATQPSGPTRTAPIAPYLLREPRPGDLGWIVQRHGALYAEEYGWNDAFEALVARIVADYVAERQPTRERCWIAEHRGENVGCVFVVAHGKAVAKLRLLLVEPKARGLGLGARLVDECVRFARQAGYRRMVLWTNSVLVAARRIYERAGFRLVEEARHHDFGPELVGQTWELRL